MYTKENIIEAALLRFKLAKMSAIGGALIITPASEVEAVRADLIDLTKLEIMFSNFYDERGKDTFRKYASVDAECMKIWKEYNELN